MGHAVRPQKFWTLCRSTERLLPVEIRELFQIVSGNVGDGPVNHSILSPRDHVIAALRNLSGCSVVGRPSEEIDHMLCPAKDERGYGSSIHVIGPATSQWESLFRQILHHRREIQLPVEPGLDRVPV